MSDNDNKSVFSLPIALCEGDNAVSAPDCIQILPAGSVTPNDGRGSWLLEDAASVIASTRARLGARDLVVDYNHQTEHASRNGRPAPAAGWITALEARPEGIFGRVKWTRKGAEQVAAREFRYISPVFNHDAKGRITRILSCALTNTPALEMAALCETNPEKEKDMDPKILAQALGLSENATEAEIIAACASACKAQCEAAREPDPARYVPIDAHNAMAAELAKLKKEQCEARAQSLVGDAKAKGKLIPAMETWAKSYAESDPDGFRAWLESAPALQLDGETVQGKPDAGKTEGRAAAQALNDEQRAICQAMGLDEAKYLEEMKSLEASNG